MICVCVVLVQQCCLFGPGRRRRHDGLLLLIHQAPGDVTGITTFSHLKANDFLFLRHRFSFALLMDVNRTEQLPTTQTFPAVVLFIFSYNAAPEPYGNIRADAERAGSENL